MVEVEGSYPEEKVDLGCSELHVIEGRSNGTDHKPVEISGSRRPPLPNKRVSKGKWTKEEDDTLQDAVKKYQAKSWKKIAVCIQGRTDVQCMHHWQKVLNPSLVKGFWTKEEDEHIINLIEKKGIKKWSEIAKQLKGRIGKQCRERYMNHLAPWINKSEWTTEEQKILINAHASYGNKWAEIAKLLPGRTENSIKNQWNCSLKKRLDNHLADDSASNVNGYTTCILQPNTTEKGCIKQPDQEPQETLGTASSPQVTLDLNRVCGYSDATAIISTPESCNPIDENVGGASHMLEEEIYTRLCYKPPQNPIRLSSQTSHMQETLDVSRLLKSVVRSRAATYGNLPSIIGKGTILTSSEASVSNQKHQKVEKSDVIEYVGKCLEEEFAEIADRRRLR